jgi:acetyltransferase
VAKSIPAANLEELERAAQGLRYPVVLKAVAPDLAHKMEAGGVLLDLRDQEELLAAAEKMTESVSRHRGMPAAGSDLGFLIQEYVRGGREVIVGMTRDPKYGPLVTFGLGGICVEAADVVLRLPPLSDLEAHEMIRQTRGFNLLRGVRGEAPVDLDALAEALQRFSQLAEDMPDIAEIEINPLLVFPHAADFRAVDVRVRLDGEPEKTD